MYDISTLAIVYHCVNGRYNNEYGVYIYTYNIKHAAGRQVLHSEATYTDRIRDFNISTKIKRLKTKSGSLSPIIGHF